MNKYQDFKDPADSYLPKTKTSSSHLGFFKHLASLKLPLLGITLLAVLVIGGVGIRSYILNFYSQSSSPKTTAFAPITSIPAPSLDPESTLSAQTPSPSPSPSVDDTVVLGASTDTTEAVTPPVPPPSVAPVGPIPDASKTFISSNSVPADGSSFSNVNVTLKDSSGNPISGHTISLSALGGTVNFKPSSSVTSPSGQASFTATSNTAGAQSITITDSTANNGAGITLAGAGTITFNSLGSPSSSSTSSGNPHCTTGPGVPNFWYTDYYPNSTVNAGTSATISITIRDCSGNTVTSDSDTISISLASGDSGNTNYPSTITARNGQVSFTVLSQVATTDIFTITDTTNNFSITDTSNKPLTINFVGGSTSNSASPSAH